MSPIAYAKWGWENSDVYLFGGYIRYGTPVITCCGCLLARDDPDDWLMSPSFDFETKEGILGHLRVHQDAGHVVPESAIRRIEADDWLA